MYSKATDLVVFGGLHDLQHTVDGHGAEQRGVLGHDLGVERGGGTLDETLAVSEVHGLADALQDLHRLVCRSEKITLTPYCSISVSFIPILVAETG